MMLTITGASTNYLVASSRSLSRTSIHGFAMRCSLAAKTVQRMWRRWRYEASASVSIPAMQATSSGGHSAIDVNEEANLVDTPRCRALDSWFSLQFPQFSAVLRESHREGRGTYQEQGSCSAKIVAERWKRLDNMGVRLIWITADLCEKSASKKLKVGNRWRQGAKNAGAKGTIGEVLAAAKAEASGAGSSKPLGRKTAPQGGDESANKMACHFFRKGEPIVALRYLQQDAQANSAGFVDSEYKLAVNLVNTASIFVQPPICNEKRFGEALKFTDRAIQTLNSHAETAALANAKEKAAIRRMELAVCAHNVGVHFMYAGRAKEAWQVVEEAHKCLGDLPADLRSHAYFTAIAKSFNAMQKLSLPMGLGLDTPGAKELDEAADKGRPGSGQRVSPGDIPERIRNKRNAAATMRVLKGVRSLGNASTKEDSLLSNATAERSVKFVVSTTTASSGAPLLPALNTSSTSSTSNIINNPTSLAHEGEKIRRGLGPIAKLQQKIRESKQTEERESVREVKSAAVQSLQAANLLASMSLVTRAMVSKTKA